MWLNSQFGVNRPFSFRPRLIAWHHTIVTEWMILINRVIAYLSELPLITLNVTYPNYETLISVSKSFHTVSTA